jgi:hypothetical protein
MFRCPVAHRWLVSSYTLVSCRSRYTVWRCWSVRSSALRIADPYAPVRSRLPGTGSFVRVLQGARPPQRRAPVQRIGQNPALRSLSVGEQPSGSAALASASAVLRMASDACCFAITATRSRFWTISAGFCVPWILTRCALVRLSSLRSVPWGQRMMLSPCLVESRWQAEALLSTERPSERCSVCRQRDRRSLDKALGFSGT